MYLSRPAVALATMLSFAVAQTSTSCDPAKKSCPSDIGLDASTFFCDFTQGSSANASWSAAAYTTLSYGKQGAEFTISQSGQAPTIQTDFYVFFGLIEVKMKAAPGTGIVSSIVLESDDLDEIDWEFLGGNTAQVETNYFGKGNTTTYDRAIYYQVSTPQETFHTYTVDWNSDRLIYMIDGTAVRTLQYDDANGGSDYPQTPMRLKLGNWAAGGPGEPTGTVEWAGGKTQFNQGPFTMYVESVSITNYNPAQSYSYSDQTGSWQSINVMKGDGTASSAVGSGTATLATATESSGSTPTGSATSSGTDTTVSAPTSMVSVAPISNTDAAVSSTVTGSAYSTNSAAISAAQPTGTDSGTASPTGASGSDSMSMSLIGASTEVPSAPTATGSSDSGASGSAASGTSVSSTGSAQQTSSSGAKANTIKAGGPLLAVALGFCML